MFHQPFGFFQDHLRHLDMALGRFVEGGADHLTVDGTLHVRDLFRPFIDQENDQDRVLMVLGGAVGDGLQDHGFARTRGADDQPALALPDGS